MMDFETAQEPKSLSRRHFGGKLICRVTQFRVRFDWMHAIDQGYLNVLGG